MSKIKFFTLPRLLTIGLILLFNNAFSGTLTLNYVQHKRVTCGQSGPEDIAGIIVYNFTASGGESIQSITWTYPDQSTSNGFTFRGSLVQTGLYEIEVVTNQGTYTDKVYLGYSISWTTQTFMVSDVTSSPYREDVINKWTSNGWCAAATSQAILPGGQDGWFSYRAVGTTTHRMIGFDQVGKPYNCHGGIDYGVYLKNNADLRRLNGTTETSISSYQSGDEIKVERREVSGNYYVSIYKNGTLLTNMSISASEYNEDWVAGGWIWNSNGVLENMCTSFKPPFPVEIVNTNAKCLSGDDGAIYINPCGDTTQYTIDWEDAGVDDYFHTKDLSPGQYHATINKGSDWQTEKWVSVGYRVDWIDETGVSTTGGLVEKTGSSGWNAGVISEKVISASADGWYEFEVTGEDQLLGFGFSVAPTGYTQSELDQGYDQATDDELWLTAGGTHQVGFPLATAKKGDIVRMTVEPGIDRIRLYINDFATYSRLISSDFSSSDDLNIHILMNTNGASLKDFKFSEPCEPVIDFKYYSKLKTAVDANYITIANDTVNFFLQARSQKAPGKFLEYKVLDQNGATVAGVDNDGSLLVNGSPKLPYNYNDNFYDMDLTQLSLSSGIYLLEVTTENGLIKKLKFRK